MTQARLNRNVVPPNSTRSIFLDLSVYTLVKDSEDRLRSSQEASLGRFETLLMSIGEKIDRGNTKLDDEIKKTNEKISTGNAKLDEKIKKLDQDVYVGKILSLSIIAILAFSEPHIAELLTYIGNFFKFAV